MHTAKTSESPGCTYLYYYVMYVGPSRSGVFTNHVSVANPMPD